MADKTPQTLAYAQDRIQTYLHEMRLFPLEQSQKNFLKVVDDRIQIIQELNHNWLKNGLVDEYENGVALLPPTQNEILREAKTAYKKQLGFTWQATQQLKQEINTAIQLSQDPKYLKLLHKIRACTDGVIKRIEPSLAINATYVNKQNGSQQTIEKIDHINLSNQARHLYSKNYPMGVFIKVLGGRYLPFAQTLDPLYGTSDGHCHGYVEDWAQQIRLNKKFRFNNGINKTVYRYQKHQARNTFLRSPIDTISEAFSSNKIMEPETEVASIVDKIVAQVDPDYIYNLGMVLNKVNSGHSIGIRRLPNSETFEFFDPNFGIVVFDDEESFKFWLSKFFLSIYAEQLAKGGDFTLIPLGKQPADTQPSIPPLRKEEQERDLLATAELQSLYRFTAHKTLDEFNKNKQRSPDPLKVKLNAFNMLSFCDRPLDEIQKYHQTFTTRLRSHFEIGPYQLKLDKQTAQIEADAHKENVIQLIRTEIARLKRTIIGDGRNKIAALNVLIADIECAENTIPLHAIIRAWRKKKFDDHDDDLLTIIHKPRIEAQECPTSFLFIDKLIAQHETSIYRITLQQQLFLQCVYQLAERNHDEKIIDIIAKYHNMDCSYHQIILELKAYAQKQSSFRQPLIQCLKQIKCDHFYQLKDCTDRLEKLIEPPKKKPWHRSVLNFLYRHKSKFIFAGVVSIALSLTIVSGGAGSFLVPLAIAFGTTMTSGSFAAGALGITFGAPLILATLWGGMSDFYHRLIKPKRKAEKIATTDAKASYTQSHDMMHDVLGVTTESKILQPEPTKSETLVPSDAVEKPQCDPPVVPQLDPTTAVAPRLDRGIQNKQSEVAIEPIRSRR